MIDRMVFTAMAGARNAVDQLAVTTNNLSNAATPGFREQLAAFRAVQVRGDGAATRISSVDSTPGFSSVSGRIEQTGNPFDLALEGDGWFSVKRQDGSLAYTREGEVTGTRVGQLRIVRADPGVLDRGFDGLYESRDKLPLADAAVVRVRQGSTESSNVSVSDAMVQMISQSRLFDLSMQLVKNADQNARSANQLIASAR
jgi:flagellar basal-body rod protein FlgF